MSASSTAVYAATGGANSAASRPAGRSTYGTSRSGPRCQRAGSMPTTSAPAAAIANGL